MPRPPTRPRRLLLALGLCTLTALAQGQTGNPALRFGVAADAPPLAFVEDGVLRGLEIDLAAALADELGVDMQLLELPQRRHVDALRGGRVDLLLSALDDAEVAALGLGASTPVLATGQMALVRAIDLDRYPREVDLLLADVPVGYEVASAGARFVHERLPRASRVPFPTAAAGIAALRRDEIGIFIHDAPTVWAVGADSRERDLAGIFRPLTRERLAWISRGRDAALRRRIDGILADWAASGRLARLINRWIPVQVQVGSE